MYGRIIIVKKKRRIAIRHLTEDRVDLIRKLYHAGKSIW
jgi:hypothetical protein